MLLVGGLFVGLAAAVSLALTAFSENLLYFYQPSEIASGQVPTDTRFRIGGLVEENSVERNSDDLVVRFTLSDCDASVPVRFKGTLPDLFREGQGIVAYGQLEPGGDFVADEVLAKHDENYMSPDVAEAMQDDQGVSCMPTNMQAQR
ncbi:CcmE/CycJ protein [Salinisphaera orenii YIM 95161]|uniref:Cytochrome c-type biogenesis protein CcmE n=1 Tax=Salinisphaera orenii YIM 95161 TaxID=1051139 RepID=A0A423PM91_9GAMM|nr:CcmE/CycJ protein [Salinisphaera halophila YIM 95161]